MLFGGRGAINSVMLFPFLSLDALMVSDSEFDSEVRGVPDEQLPDGLQQAVGLVVGIVYSTVRVVECEQFKAGSHVTPPRV